MPYEMKNKQNHKASGYSESGGSTTRRALRGFFPNSKSPQQDIDLNNGTLRQRSRMLYSAAPLATSAINTNRTKVIGTGLQLKSTIDHELLKITPEQAKLWQQKTEAEFKLWSTKKQNCDATGMNNFESMQQLAIKSWLSSGDVFAVIKRTEKTVFNPYTLRIHIVEADRIRTPSEFESGFLITSGTVPEGKKGAGNTVYDGVEIDNNGKVCAYYVFNSYPNDYSNKVGKDNYVRIQAYGEKTGLPNILQIMDSERPDQYRGVPYLAQVIEPLLQLRRYTESELMAALVQSFFTAWIETNSDTSEIPINEVGAGDIAGIPGENPEDSISSSENEYEMSPGAVVHLAPGETIKFGNPNIPTAGFETFVKTISRLIGAALELPYDVLVKEFDSSYSASRGALLEAWEAFKMRRAWFIDDFCQPVYELFLTEAVANGRIKAPGFFTDPVIRDAWCRANWIGPVQGQLNPKDEVEAAVIAVEHGFKTHEHVTMESGGGNWEANAEQLKREKQILSESNTPYQNTNKGDVTDNE